MKTDSQLKGESVLRSYAMAWDSVINRSGGLLCDQPGGCGYSCRRARARGDDMDFYWPDGDLDFNPDDYPVR